MAPDVREAICSCAHFSRSMHTAESPHSLRRPISLPLAFGRAFRSHRSVWHFTHRRDRAMSVIDILTQRNQAFADSSRFSAELKIIPSMKTMIVGCVDPRVDPAEIFQLEPGEAVVYRNVGGRVTPATLETLSMLRIVARSSGGNMGPGWNLLVLHHTDCGINCLRHEPELAQHFGVPLEGLDSLAITDPRTSVAVDIAALRASPLVSGDFLVSGLVYDVATGKVETVVPPAPLRTEATA